MTAFETGQLRSALALPLVRGAVSVVALLAPIVLLELDVSAAVLELLGVELLVLGAVVLAVDPEPAGVPVLPMEVDCELCWPAPTAGSFAAGFGGVLCAKADAAMPAAAIPASMPLKR